MLQSKVLIVVLILLNSIVLLGQLWPEGAPPFAHIVNIIFLFLSLIYFIFAFLKMRTTK